MFETLKEKIAISEDELITAIALDEEGKAKRKAGKAKKEAIAELFKTKDTEYLGAFVKKRDGTKKEFFVS